MQFGLIEESCHHDRRGRYCSKCGRETNPPRLTFRTLMTELSANWLQKGFRQTALGLLVAPGRQVRRYLLDDRMLMVRPITYLVVISAFHLWVLSLAGPGHGRLDPETLQLSGEALQNKLLLAALGWFNDRFYQFALLQAAMVALLLRFVFYRGSRLKLPEYTILMTYVLAQSFLMQAVLALLLVPFQTALPSGLRLLIATLYSSWAIAQFHQQENPSGLLKGAASYLAGLMLMFALLLGGFALVLISADGAVGNGRAVENSPVKSVP